MQKLSKTQERWLAVGLLLGIIIILSATVFIPWYNTLNETLEKIDDQVYQIQRYQRVIASREEVLSEVEKGRKKINALGYFYTQETYSLAAAELQKRIKGIVERAGGDISSTQVLPHKEQNELVRIAVKVRLVGDMDMLRVLLFEIQAEKPLMGIENITIIPKRGRRNRKTRKIEETGLITITMEVSSYMRKMSDESE
ncbi:MAG: type II secretion system protein GspM [Methylococcaceae bacterium]|nr:type II secretion system protein GspM [Methylococcaceae bacterium]